MIWNLIVLNIRALFSRMFMRSRNQKRNPAITVLIVLLAIYVVGVFLSLSAMIFLELNKQFFAIGLGWLYFSLMGIAIFASCFVGTVFAAQPQLFNARDNELLLSLPVRPSAILTGRLASLLLLEYLFDALIAVPAFVIWVTFQPVTAAGIVFFLIVFLTVPLLALALASLFAWVVALFTSRLRNKNIITIVLWAAFFYLYLKFYLNIQVNLRRLLAMGLGLSDVIRKSLFPAYHLGLAIAEGSAVSLLIYLICAVAPFILVVLILSANFVRIATTNRGAAKIKYTEKALKVSGVRAAFTKKELRHFWSNPMYIMNSALGGVFMLIGAVILAINRSVALDFLAHLNNMGLELSPASLVILTLGMISALNLVSAPSVSLEGKNLWIAKSLPVPAIDVLMAKVQMHLLVCGIPAVVSGLICALVLPVTPLEFFLALVIPALLTLLTALFGVVVNLQFPKFDWINELQPIKQGVSVLLTMLGVFAFIAALAVLYFVLSAVLAVELYMTFCAALFAILSGLLYGYLRTGGSRRFEALSN